LADKIAAMTERLVLDAIVDDSAFLSYEHQLHLVDVAEELGEHEWHVDLNARTLTLSGRYTLEATVHLLGTASEGDGSWLWGWANPSGFSPQVTELGARVAEFGRQHGVPELAAHELTLTPDVAARVTDAAKVISGHWTSYSGAVGPGTRAYFLIDAPQLALPPPSTPRWLRVVGESLGTGMVHDHRRAVTSYARLRGLSVATGNDDTALRVRLPDGEVTLDFDHIGRISNMSGQVAPS
jgi:hypothetical protein